MENQLILDISFDVCILLLDADTVNCLQCIYHVRCLPTGYTYAFCQLVASMHFYKMLASSHVIKLINTGTITCHSTLDR